MLKDLPPSSTLHYKNVRYFLDIYRTLFTDISVICVHLLNSIKLEDLFSKPMLSPATLMLHYLSERIVVTPFHIINIITRDPKYAHSDIAALNRGLFESSLNFCFLISKDQDMRFRQYYLSSVNQEFRIQKSMGKYTVSENVNLRKPAEKQKNIKNSTTEEIANEVRDLIGDVGRFPNIWNRCEALGEDWMFSYDSKYRGLSSWQHGDVSRAFMTQTMSQLDPAEAERPVFESLAQCAWAWDIALKYAETLQAICKAPSISDKLSYLDHAGYQAMTESIGEAIHKYQI